MEERDIWVIAIIFLVIFITIFFVWRSLEKKIYGSPEELLPPEEIIPKNVSYCYDSDLGLNYFESGVVVWGIGDGNLHYSYDYCTSDPLWGEETLFEMYCEENSFKIKNIKCPGLCEQNICID